MKGVYNLTLRDGKNLDVDVLRRQNWNVVIRYVTNPPRPIKAALESGARIEIERSDIQKDF